MQEAKILHCEDNKTVRENVMLVLGISGLHRVVAYADSLSGSLTHLEEIQAGELDANVILLDGNLKGAVALNHPRYIVDKAKSLGLKLPIIGLSLNGLAEKGLVVDRDICADIKKIELGRDIDLLGRILDELPDPS